MAIFTYLINICGVSITRYGTAAQRTTIGAASNVFIWLFFLFIPINGQPLETFQPLQLVGFIVLLLGVFLYNEILVLPCFRFNLYTKQAIKYRETHTAAVESRKISVLNLNHTVDDVE